MNVTHTMQQHRAVSDAPHLTYFPDVIEAGDLGGQASVNTQELLVEQSGQGKAVKGIHAGIIHALRVLNLACDERTTIKTPMHLQTGASGVNELFKPRLSHRPFDISQ